MVEKISGINDRHQITHQGQSEIIKQGLNSKMPTCRQIIFNSRNPKTKRNY